MTDMVRDAQTLLHDYAMDLQALRDENAALKASVAIHNDSAVEAWGLTRQWQDRVQNLEPLQAENAALKAQVERLSAPLNEDEWEHLDCATNDFDGIIADRVAGIRAINHPEPGK